ncbi:MAG: glycosyltransferase family 9 protein [Thermodesulfobacteriota bacterium]
MDACLYRDRYEQSCIDLLCEMATAFDPGSGLNARATSALFDIVVEGLCDEFEDMQTEIYDRVMCQIVSFCRKTARGKKLDETLDGFGLTSLESLLGRAAGLRKSFPLKEEIAEPEKIMFLSRVTFGADIAITSVLMQRFAQLFPGAELVLLGSAKLNGIFGGLKNLRIRELSYPRRGGLIQRFSAWFSALAAVEEETGGLGGRFLVIDPDSRLSQLGILPVADAGNYFFFNSRHNGNSTHRQSMSELANEWANRVLPESGFCHPGVWIDGPSTTAAGDMLGRLRRTAGHIVTVNLGVGGNSRKRLDDDFEFDLLASLLSEKGTAVILDCGAEAEEKERAGRLLTALGEKGFPTAHADMSRPADLTEPGIVSIVCGIGEIAALISGSDEFIGYDSACQHIAAAAGIPSCTVFAGSNNPRFVRRWQARGKAVSRVIHVDNLSRDRMFDNADIIARIHDARNRA